MDMKVSPSEKIDQSKKEELRLSNLRKLERIKRDYGKGYEVGYKEGLDRGLTLANMNKTIPILKEAIWEADTSLNLIIQLFEAAAQGKFNIPPELAKLRELVRGALDTAYKEVEWKKYQDRFVGKP